ncbi:hypothetical protein Tco_0569681 [Tanacetum coccineum]
MMTSKLPSLIGIRSILKRCFNKVWQVTVTGSRLLPLAGPLFLQFSVRWPTFRGGSISPEGFLSPVVLWLVIIVAVVGVTVVVVIIVVVVVVVESSYVVKLSFVIT